jgi:pullulanase/glycogen debranching enzyme
MQEIAHSIHPETRSVKKLASASDPFWYKDAIIYELHVRAFADSNGDGIGDFPGLLSRLDYLQDLGVTCIWLLPFFPRRCATTATTSPTTSTSIRPTER